jgi:hypothetical protein
MGVGLYLTGTFSLDKPIEDWLEQVASWLESHEEEPLMHCQFGETDEGQPTLFVEIHPCAEGVEISSPEPGACLVTAKTNTAGPGYHIFLCDLLHSLGIQFGIAWDKPEEGVEGDETGYFFQRDASAVRHEMLRWLGAVAQIIVDNCKNEKDLGRQMVAMPIEHRYPDQTGILTPFGPRSPAWFERLLETPDQGIVFFPWWQEGVGANFFLGRAICRMWQEVCWRTPITEDEGELAMDVHLDLERALHLDRDAKIPWREWSELLGYLNEYFHYVEFQHEEIQEEEIQRRAKQEDPNRPLIGYRRGRVNVMLSGGWSLTIPGELAEEWDENGETWSAWHGGRTIWFKPWSVSGPNDAELGAQEILDSLPWPVNAEFIDHKDDETVGRAVFIPAEKDGQQLWHLKACSAVAGKFAECNIFLQNQADREWALEIWKSLQN